MEDLEKQIAIIRYRINELRSKLPKSNPSSDESTVSQLMDIEGLDNVNTPKAYSHEPTVSKKDKELDSIKNKLTKYRGNT